MMNATALQDVNPSAQASFFHCNQQAIKCEATWRTPERNLCYQQSSETGSCSCWDSSVEPKAAVKKEKEL